MKYETNYLKTVHHYANLMGVTTSYIYRMIKQERIAAIDIDGMQFIDIGKFPAIPAKSK